MSVEALRSSLSHSSLFFAPGAGSQPREVPLLLFEKRLLLIFLLTGTLIQDPVLTPLFCVRVCRLRQVWSAGPSTLSGCLR